MMNRMEILRDIKALLFTVRGTDMITGLRLFKVAHNQPSASLYILLRPFLFLSSNCCWTDSHGKVSYFFVLNSDERGSSNWCENISISDEVLGKLCPMNYSHFAENNCSYKLDGKMAVGWASDSPGGNTSNKWWHNKGNDLNSWNMRRNGGLNHVQNQSTAKNTHI